MRAPITGRYVLVVTHAITVDATGVAWASVDWRQDLCRHLLYLRDLEVVSPVRRVVSAEGLGLSRIDLPPDARLAITALPGRLGTLAGQVRAIPRLVPVLWRGAGRAAYLQPDNIAWLPGWIGCAAALARRRRLVVVVENAHWRPGPGASLSRRLYGGVWECVVRALARRAAIVFYTQPSYRESLPTGGQPGIVSPASWVDEADLLPPAEADCAWDSKGHRLRLLFAGRLVEGKGVGVLLDAVERLRREGCAVDIDIIGEGPLRPRCAAAAADPRQPPVRLLDPVPYGPRFFELLRGYHAALVPLVSDEQPRIIADAYSQAVPVIASDTDGNRPHVEDGRTGLLVPPGDAAALAGRIAALAAAPAPCRALGLAARARVGGMTHLAMHLARWEGLASIG